MRIPYYRTYASRHQRLYVRRLSSCVPYVLFDRPTVSRTVQPVRGCWEYRSAARFLASRVMNVVWSLSLFISFQYRPMSAANNHHTKAVLLWSTTTGRAKACARRTGRIIRCRGVPVTACSSFDDFGATQFLNIEQTALNAGVSPPLLILFVSTTGDGEQCDSIKECWSALWVDFCAYDNDLCLEETRYLCLNRKIIMFFISYLVQTLSTRQAAEVSVKMALT